MKSLLNYEPQELIGLPYAALVAEQDRMAANHTFNKRRRGARAAKVPLHLNIKGDPTISIGVEITATTLYSAYGEFLGTIGVVARPMAPRHEDRLRQRLAELESLLTTLVSSAEQLFHTVAD